MKKHDFKKMVLKGVAIAAFSTTPMTAAETHANATGNESVSEHVSESSFRGANIDLSNLMAAADTTTTQSTRKTKVTRTTTKTPSTTDATSTRSTPNGSSNTTSSSTYNTSSSGSDNNFTADNYSGTTYGSNNNYNNNFKNANRGNTNSDFPSRMQNQTYRSSHPFDNRFSADATNGGNSSAGVPQTNGGSCAGKSGCHGQSAPKDNSGSCASKAGCHGQNGPKNNAAPSTTNNSELSDNYSNFSNARTAPRSQYGTTTSTYGNNTNSYYTDSNTQTTGQQGFYTDNSQFTPNQGNFSQNNNQRFNQNTAPTYQGGTSYGTSSDSYQQGWSQPTTTPNGRVQNTYRSNGGNYPKCGASSCGSK